MWKNKEVLAAAGAGTVFLIVQALLLNSIEVQMWKKVLLEAVPAAMFLLYFGSAYYRSRKIKSYTEYLNRIQNGEYSLPIEENEEGELSILQNEVYKVTKRLMEQAELLEEKTIFLSNSLSNISHQLKTPVTALLMMADLLQQPDLPEEKRIQFTQNITLGLERMEWLVQGLLTLAKLDSGSIAMKEEMVQVPELIRESIRHLQMLAEEKKVIIQIEGNAEVTYTGDFSWSVEALSNIIKNCLEHTGAGGTVQISFGVNQLYTIIRIQDNGEGIAQEELHHIFQRFYKGKNASSNSVGIGLALAKEIITRQKGVISVESKIGKGTEFVLKFYGQ